MSWPFAMICRHRQDIVGFDACFWVCKGARRPNWQTGIAVSVHMNLNNGYFGFYHYCLWIAASVMLCMVVFIYTNDLHFHEPSSARIGACFSDSGRALQRFFRQPFAQRAGSHRAGEQET